MRLEVDFIFVVILFASFFTCLWLEFVFDYIRIHKGGRKFSHLKKKVGSFDYTLKKDPYGMELKKHDKIVFTI